MDNNLDIRILKLAKWEVPKSESVFAYDSGESYLSIGYFDMIDVKNVENDQDEHPLLSAYGELHRVSGPNKKISDNYSMQELIVFANCEGNQERICRFWAEDSLIMFVSLIHIDNESDIGLIINKISEVFDGCNYLCYFSFDYSGVVLFAKGISIKQYLENMFKLNYEPVDNKKVIRDSYSLYGFRKKKLEKYFKQFQNNNYNCDEDNAADERFSISVNIGIQNYNTYTAFAEQIKKLENTEIREYNLFGRHDVSIVNDNADLQWLLYVQYLMDEFTSIQEHDERNREEKLFSTHETFVKVRLDNMNLYDTTDDIPNDFYNHAKCHLQRLCDDFLEKLQAKGEIYNGQYRVPIQAVQHSIISILKNRFAEDFVLCIYQSFCEFLAYLTEQITQPDDVKAGHIEKAIQFDTCFDKYFRGVNSLVNSAMHSERQFIQATAFNAIIYDIPPKIMAFYVAIIQRMQRLIRSDADKKYTFLLTPSFHNEIIVKVISYYPDKGGVPRDRILMVKINEKSLYNPEAVIQRMGHEIAHFVGEQLRCRENRKKRIKYSLIHVALNLVMHKIFIEEGAYNDLVKNIYDQLPADLIFSDLKNNYSQELCTLVWEFPNEFLTNEGVQGILAEYIRDVLKKYLGDNETLNEEKCKELKRFISYVASRRSETKDALIENLLKRELCSEREIEIFVRMIMTDINRGIEWLCVHKSMKAIHRTSQSNAAALASRVQDATIFQEFGRTLISLYRECFADMQMILLTGLDYWQYLDGFCREENLDVTFLGKMMDDNSRVSMVAFVLNGIGVWDINVPNKEIEHNFKLQSFHKEILQTIAALEDIVVGGNFEPLFQSLRKPTKEFVDNTSEEDSKRREENQCQRKNSREQNVKDNKLRSLLNLELAYYLTKCMSESLKHYGTEEKIKEIKALRKTIGIIKKCNNIEIVFRTVCKEIDTYKNNLMLEQK